VFELNTLRAAHGDHQFLAALDRAVAFGRWRAADVRSILAAGPGTADPRPAGDALILDLPVVPVRPLADYAIGGRS
jgi:phage tail protein X